MPVLADLRPSGRYLMSELVAIRDPAAHEMLAGGLLHRDCMTVTGHTLAQNREGSHVYERQDIIRPLSHR